VNRALCDPNYKPAELYQQIEALLLFYDQVLLYAPSQDQILRAGLDWRRLKRLITEGLVVPVGREFWFDPKERDALTAHFAGNSEKSSTYRWSDLDEAILSLGPLSSLPPGRSSPGFLRVNDDHRHFADEIERTLPEIRSPEFLALVEQATKLRSERRLPNELLHGPMAEATPEKLAARLAFCAAGDLRLCQNIGVSSIFSTLEMGEVYRAASHSFAPASKQPEQLTVVDRFQEYILSPDELQIASRLALQIVQSDEIGPLDIDLLLEYRRTSCWIIFRDFVVSRLEELGPTHSERAEARLRSAFESELNTIGKISLWEPLGIAAMVSVGGQFLVRERLQDHPITRRGIFTLLAGLSFNLFGALLPKVATATTAELVDPRFHALFVLIRQQQERRAKRSGA
jgi:hypothetical protein